MITSDQTVRQAPQYEAQEYWDQRYAFEQNPYDWYQGWHGLRELFQLLVPVDAEVLQVGMGNSQLGADMVLQGGYQHIVNIDFSAVVVEQMREMHRSIPQLAYELADCRNMPEYEDNTFDVAFDKGTLDAMLCGQGSLTNVKHMLAECMRVIKPGGLFLVITYGDPMSRLKLFLDQEFACWEDVQVYSITHDPRACAQQRGGAGATATSSYSSGYGTWRKKAGDGPGGRGTRDTDCSNSNATGSGNELYEAAGSSGGSNSRCPLAPLATHSTAPECLAASQARAEKREAQQARREERGSNRRASWLVMQQQQQEQQQEQQLKLQQVALEEHAPVLAGPFHFSDLDAMESMNNQDNVHFVYVLTK